MEMYIERALRKAMPGPAKAEKTLIGVGLVMALAGAVMTWDA